MATNIRERALNKALTVLDALGVDYKVYMDGYYYGDLEIGGAPEDAQVVSKRSPNYGKHVAFYGPLTKSLVIGDVVVVDESEVIAQGMTLKGLRTAIYHYASKLYGNQSVMTAQDGSKLEIMRIK